uniref:Uncharacterized protein n=1 Tax=Vitis vinifera TaxID=29760 RepID=F6HT50_VITVI
MKNKDHENEEETRTENTYKHSSPAVMQSYENKSWKPCKTCLKGDLGGPSKTK